MLRYSVIFCSSSSLLILLPSSLLLLLSSVAMDKHKEAVEKLQKANKMAGKVSRNQLREIAQLLAQVHLTSPSPDHVMCIHRWVM